MNSTAAAQVSQPASSDIFDRLIGDDGDYHFSGLTLDEGLKALVSALEAKFEANQDPRFKHEISWFEMGDGYALYVYAVFPSAEHRLSYELELDRASYEDGIDDDPAFDIFDMPWAAKTNISGCGKTGEMNSISRLWFLNPSPAEENEYAVVAGDCIMSVGATAAEDYAATGLDVRSDGAGGWEALSVSDTDWQPVRIIRISPDLAAHIRQHGAPASWATIEGVAHLERESA